MAAIGSGSQPTYVDGNGAAKASNETLGTDTKPLKMVDGVLTPVAKELATKEDLETRTGAFIHPDLKVLKTTEYKFPVAWASGKNEDYTVENDCILFYHIQMKLDGQICNTDKLFTIATILNGTTELVLDGINPITNGSDTCIGSIACKAGTVIRLKNSSSVALPVSTASEPLFYILRETGPLKTSATFNGLMRSDLDVKRTVDYTFTEAWAANSYKDYTIQNDCILSYKFQIKCDGQICNTNRMFMMYAVVDGTEVPIDGINEVETGDDVRMGTILCKTGAVIRMKNVSTTTIPVSTSSFYSLKELA